MTVQIADLPSYGSKEFWKIYDELCKIANLKKVAEREAEFTLVEVMRRIMSVTVLEIQKQGRSRYGLSRLEFGWKRPAAWLALGGSEFRREKDGFLYANISPGDVMVIDYGWDREIVVTHHPIDETRTMGSLHRSDHPQLLGIWMPLYTKVTIMECISIMNAVNAQDSLDRAEKSSNVWHWH